MLQKKKTEKHIQFNKTKTKNETLNLKWIVPLVILSFSSPFDRKPWIKKRVGTFRLKFDLLNDSVSFINRIWCSVGFFRVYKSKLTSFSTSRSGLACASASMVKLTVTIQINLNDFDYNLKLILKKIPNTRANTVNSKYIIVYLYIWVIQYIRADGEQCAIELFKVK